jgi:lipopolysaccharide transport system permease protein
MPKSDNDIEYVIESSQRKLLDWNELWQYRELFYFFTWRDLKVKYKQAALGIIWVILQPLFTVFVFSFFFGRSLNIPSTGMPYPIFVFSGLLLWTVFSTTINNAGNSMLTNASIIKKIYFPRIIIPVSSLLASLVDFLIAFAVFLLALLYYEVSVNFFLMLVYWPVAIILLLMGTLGLSCWLAALNVKYRDFRYVIPFGLQIALFLSPVIYPIGIVESSWTNYALAVNPMYAVIMLFRVPLTGFFPGNIELAISILSAFFLCGLGIYYFKKTEAYFADIA